MGGGADSFQWNPPISPVDIACLGFERRFGVLKVAQHCCFLLINGAALNVNVWVETRVCFPWPAKAAVRRSFFFKLFTGLISSSLAHSEREPLVPPLHSCSPLGASLRGIVTSAARPASALKPCTHTQSHAHTVHMHTYGLPSLSFVYLSFAKDKRASCICDVNRDSRG